MPRKYSMAHLGCLNWTPAEMIYNAKAIGYDYVSIRTIVQGIKGEADYGFQHHPELFRLTKQAIADTGVGIHDIELAKIDDSSAPVKYESAFAAAQELGVINVISSIWTDNRPWYLKQFEQVCDLAAKYGLMVSLEFVTWASVWNLQQAREVLETVNRPNAGLLVDTLHAHRARPKAIPDRSDREALIYNGREARYYLTEADNGVDAASMIRAMKKDTILSLELPHLERARELGTFEHQRRVLESTKLYLRANGIE